MVAEWSLFVASDPLGDFACASAYGMYLDLTSIRHNGSFGY